MRSERAALLERVASIADADAEARPAEGEGEAGWSVKEQLSHLAEMEAGYRGWVQRAVAEDRPDVTEGTRADPVAIPLERAHEATVAQHIAELERQRARTCEVIAALTPEQFDRTASNRAFGELTVLQWLRSYYRHDRMHAAQIEGRESEYQPRYLAGESDQRRRA